MALRKVLQNRRDEEGDEMIVPGYDAQPMVDRILALIPMHPEILEFSSPFRLFDIPEFSCSDLNPTLAQAWNALVTAKEQWHHRSRPLRGVD